jgi:MerR family transcriptional regulator/heat shock protein HspR
VSDAGRPLYLIGVVADMLRIHPQTLRLYERQGLIRPSRTVGRTRMYSVEDVEDIRRILRLTRDLGVNLAGVEIILKMRRQMLMMQEELEELTSHVHQQGGTPARSRAGEGSGLVRVADRGLRKIDVF